MTIIYGIKSCSTMKKAFNLLDELTIQYQFHDYKKQGITAEKLQYWVEQLGMDKVLNKRGTTWRKLTDKQKQTADNNPQKAIELMVENPSMIKRPIIEVDDELLCGFDEVKYKEIYGIL